MATPIATVMIILLITVIFDFVGLIREGAIFSLTATITSLAFAGYLVASDQTVIIAEAYNANTATWAIYTVNASPELLLIYALLVVFSFYVTMHIFQGP